MTDPNDDDGELDALLDAILVRYQHDFRHYSRASLRRRVARAKDLLACPTTAALQTRIAEDATAFSTLLQVITVPHSEMFRDPQYFLALREHAVPVLRTYPSLKVWVAGCSTGEEVYSLAILLAEEGLLERTLFYATDINPKSLRAAEAGIYELGRFQQFTENHRLGGGKSSLSDWYQAAYGSAVLDKSLRKRVVFSDHSLATDHVFAEVQLISCRNVLIYFDRVLQDQVVGLFHESLCRRGFLGLGLKETLRFGAHARAFEEIVKDARLYRRTS